MATPVDDQVWSPVSGPVVVPGAAAIAGTIDFDGDTDLFRIPVLQDHGYIIEVSAADGLALQAQLYTPLFFPAGVHVEVGEGRSWVVFAADADAMQLLELGSGVSATGGYTVSATDAVLHLGSTSVDYLYGGGEADVFLGLGGNDAILGGGGDDYIDGGRGIDTAIFSGPRAGYAVQHFADGHMLVTSTVGEGRDEAVLVNVERLDFSDFGRAFDLDGNAGTVARMLGAVFGAEAVHDKAYAGIGLDLVDGGMSDASLVQLALDVALGANASHEAVVTLLFSNITRTAPSSTDLAAYVGLLESGAETHTSLALLAARTDANAVNIGWDGLMATGLGYW